MIDQQYLQDLNRRTQKLVLKLAIEGSRTAKHVYARDRAMRPHAMTFMLKGSTNIDYRVIVKRAKWIYDRLIRLEIKGRKACGRHHDSR